MRIVRNFLFCASIVFAAASPASAQFAAQQTWAGTTTGTANAIVVTIPNISSAADLVGVPVRFVPSATNTGATTASVGGTAGLSVLKTSATGLTPLTGGEIVSGVLTEVISDGTEYVLAIYAAPLSAIPLQSNTTFYVATTGSDSNNSCLISGSPCQTIQHAWNVMVGGYSLNGHAATIQLAAGTYSLGLSASSMPTGVNAATGSGGRFNPNTIIVNGSGSSNTTISAVDAIVGAGPVGFTIQNMTLTSSTNDLSVDGGATISVGAGVVFGAASTYQMLAQGGTIVAFSSYTVSGSAQAHIEVTYGGSVIISGSPTITFSGSPTFATAVVQVSQSGSVYMVTPSFSGSVNGPKYLISNNGGIYTQGQTCSSYLPGSSGGSVLTGGYCN